MRFHHSTRRGRNRLGQHSQHHTNSRFPQHSSISMSRWSQLGYCRETNLHFNRRLPIEPPDDIATIRRRNNSGEFESSVGQSSSQANLNGFEGASGQRSGEQRTKQSKSTDNEQNMKRFSTHAQQQIDERFHGLTLREAKCQASKDKQADEPIDPLSPPIWQSSSKKLDMEAVREKLVAQVEKHPFWSNKAARKMHLTSLEERRVYNYELVSYCERRELDWRYESYAGGLISSTTPFRRALVAETPPSHLATPIRSSLYVAKVKSPIAPADLSITQNVIPLNNNNNNNNKLASSATTTIGSGDSFWTSTAAGSAGSSHLAGKSARLTSRPALLRRSFSGTTTASQLSGLAGPSSPLERPMPSPELVWSIEVPVQVRPQPFVGYVHSSELANSSFVKRCHGCQGRGRLKCASCYGVGYEVCISCSGKGTSRNLSASGAGSSASARYSGRNYSNSADYDHHSRQSSSANPDSADSMSPFSSVDNSGRGRGAGEPGGITLSGSAWHTETCHNCNGAGQKRCWTCAGKSYNTCDGCLGSGQLRCYLNLNITWTNHRDECILNNNDNIIPRDRLKLSTGSLLADQIGDRLKPLQCNHIHVDGATNQQQYLNETNQLYLASKKLLEKHNRTYKQEKLLKQRHKVTLIECYVINYEWKQRRGQFVIYGDERKVYIAKYPFKSLCSIT